MTYERDIYTRAYMTRGGSVQVRYSRHGSAEYPKQQARYLIRVDEALA
jgi:hypothetical protein